MFLETLLEQWLLDVAEKESFKGCNQISEERGGEKPLRLQKTCSKTYNRH